jgi:hypothetical protein
MSLNRRSSLLALVALLLAVGCADATLDPIQAGSLDVLQRLDCAQLDEVRAHLYQHAPGELAPIYLKVPFEVRSRGVGREWVWVQVVRWEADGAIEGILVDPPRRVGGIRPGAYIRFHVDDVADYHERMPDGTHHGNALKGLVEGGPGLYLAPDGGNIPAAE